MNHTTPDRTSRIPFPNVRRIVAALMFVLSAAAIAGCNRVVSAKKEEPAKAPPNPMEIQAGDALLQRLKIGEPTWAEVGDSITVAARVEVDETRIARVGSPVMGRITELNVREGQEVMRGQPIAVINSTGLSDAQLGLLKALSQVQLAQRAVERAEILLNAGVIGSAELRRREAELTQAMADLSASRDQLRILGMPQEAMDQLEKTRSIHSLLTAPATMDGIIVQRHVAIGQVIQPADTLAEIADLSNVWLVADVPEQSAGSLTEGQFAEAEIEALPGQKIRGKLSYVAATVNPDTRTVRVRMDLPNPRHKYKPAMLASMTVLDPKQKKQVIPASAVVREGNTELVFIQRAPDRFELRRVMLGEERGGMRVLLDGVRPGERIVVDGAFHLNNERKRIAVQGA